MDVHIFMLFSPSEGLRIRTCTWSSGFRTFRRVEFPVWAFNPGTLRLDEQTEEDMMVPPGSADRLFARVQVLGIDRDAAVASLTQI